MDEEGIMKYFFILGAALAGLSVVAGAFGAHALKSKLTPKLLTIFETAARYQMYHALGLIMVAVVNEGSILITIAGWLFLGGIIIFSGSLYILSLTGIRWLGAITPIGGLAFIIGWACLAIGFRA